MTCPPGTLCHHRHDCTDLDCPGHPRAMTVARIKQSMLGAEPLPPTSWRDYVTDLAFAMLLVFTVMLASACIVIIFALSR